MNESQGVRAKMTELGRMVKAKLLPNRAAFAVLVFTDEGGDARTEYVSSLGEAELRQALLECLTMMAQPGDAGAARVHGVPPADEVSERNGEASDEEGA